MIMDTKKHRTMLEYTSVIHTLPHEIRTVIFRAIKRPLALARIKRTCKLFNESISNDKVCTKIIDTFIRNIQNINTLLLEAVNDGDVESVIFCVNKGAMNFDMGIIAAIKRHNDVLIDFFRERGVNCWNYILDAALSVGNRKLIDEMMIEKGAPITLFSVRNAAEANNLQIVELGIQKYGVTSWNEALYGAAKGGHKDLIDLCVEKGANDWEKGLRGAVSGDQLDLIDFFIGKGVNIDYLCILEAISNNNEILTRALVDKMGPVSKELLDSCLSHASGRGNINLAKFFVQKGAVDFNAAMKCAAIGSGDMEIIEYLIELGACDWDGALRGILSYNRPELVDFFIGKGARIDFYCVLDAISHGYEELSRDLLVRMGPVDKDILNLFLKTAVETGNLTLIKLFIKNGADNIESAMEFAAARHYWGIHKYLAELVGGHNAPINN